MAPVWLTTKLCSVTPVTPWVFVNGEKNSELGFEVEVVGQIEGRMGRGLAGLEAELDLRWAALGLFFKKSSTFDAYSELCIFFVFL